MIAFESKIDSTDVAILERLMLDGRATWADLAVSTGLTAPGVANRVRRLEERGIIRQFAAWVDPSFVTPVSAFLAVSATEPDRLPGQVAKLAAVQECHLVAGDRQYLLKVRCTSLAQLGELVRTLGARASVQTMVVLSTIKESPVLPVPKPTEEE
jgi:Lrp/AsnC family leucine-responsive transcriptional regulator